ncbi:hypothetical protein D3C75_828800 [compost metagenome]
MLIRANGALPGVIPAGCRFFTGGIAGAQPIFFTAAAGVCPEFGRFWCWYYIWAAKNENSAALDPDYLAMLGDRYLCLDAGRCAAGQGGFSACRFQYWSGYSRLDGLLVLIPDAYAEGERS